MARPKAANPKKKLVLLRFSEPQLREIDAFAAILGEGRTTAIRMLVHAGLSSREFHGDRQ